MVWDYLVLHETDDITSISIDHLSLLAQIQPKIVLALPSNAHHTYTDTHDEELL